MTSDLAQGIVAPVTDLAPADARTSSGDTGAQASPPRDGGHSREIVDFDDLFPLPPEPGERCALCDRRKNKPRQPTSPETRKVRAGMLPHERADSVEEALDALQAYVGADSASYPRGVLIEALVVLGGQQREQLASYFKRTGEYA